MAAQEGVNQAQGDGNRKCRTTDLCRILSLSPQIRQHDEVPEEEAPWEGKQPCILLDRMKSKPLEDEDGIEGA